MICTAILWKGWPKALSLKDAERERRRRGRPADPRAACMRSALPDRDGRSADEIVGYNDDGLW